MNFFKKNWMSLRKRVMLAIGEQFYVKRVDNALYLLDIKNRVDRHIDVSNSYEKEQVEFLFGMLKQNSCTVFFDIGSHWGYYSILFALQYGFEGARIYAFEPAKNNRYQLYANLFMNKLEQDIKVFSYGLSDYDGEAPFYNYDEGNRGKSRISTEGVGNIQVRKLDSIISLESESIGIKIDVEGHEANVIEGMKLLLANNKCVIQVESFENNFAIVEGKLSEMGYSYLKSIQSDHYFSNFLCS